jgi:hypothetical protein
MIMVKTEDLNGTIHLTPIRNNNIYLQCRSCGGLFPIDSICEYMEELGGEDFDSTANDICEECLNKRCEREDDMLRNAHKFAE